MHYQYPNPQGKLIRVITGRIQDVAVDLRAGSPTYGKHITAFLDDVTCQALWVPPGFAHGFMSFAQGAIVQYECSTYYEDAYAKDLLWNDPDLIITWGLKMGQAPVVSQKDRKATLFRDTQPLEMHNENFAVRDNRESGSRAFDVISEQQPQSASPKSGRLRLS